MTVEVPAHLREAAREALEALQAFMQARGQATAQAHAEAFEQYRAELEAAFMAASILPEPQPFDPAQPPPLIQRQWDPLTFRQTGGDTMQSFAALVDALQAVDVDDFQVQLETAADEGYARELWLLALGGLDTETLADFTPEDWGPTLRDAGYRQEDWEQRLNAWGTSTKGKMAQLLTALAVAGATWPETAEAYDRIAQQHTKRVTGLLDNELFRAYTVGSMVGLGVAQRQLDAEVEEVWICRTTVSGELDPLVCPICKPLHITVTPRIPVDHTHPGCRCLKVPVSEVYQPTVVPYEGGATDAE
jgi:hypothetical protein